MDKNKYGAMLRLADDAVVAVLAPGREGVPSIYNGHVASFGVSVLMIGVNPTFAYFKDSTPETWNVLEL